MKVTFLCHTIVLTYIYHKVKEGITMKQNKLMFSLLLIFALFVCSLAFTGQPAQAAGKKAKLNVKKLDMTMNSNFTLRVYNMKKKQKAAYTSSEETIATVSSQYSSGKRATIRARGIGTAIIYVSITKKKKTVRRLKCRVNVSPSGVSIKFLKRTLELNNGEWERVETIIKPNTSTERPVYEIEDDSVASINSQGVVTALKPGITKVTATLLSTGQEAHCTIIVNDDSTPRPPEKEYKKSSIAMMEVFLYSPV